MKLKAIFALFNGVLVASFLIIFLMPRILLGADYFSLFWSKNWIIAVVFVATLAALNAYFISHWGLFRHLEREDWPALISYLEDRILGKGRARSLSVRMILNAYLITSNTEGIRALEAFLREKKPAMIGKFSLQFGIPYLLMKEPAVSEAFFSSLLTSRGLTSRDWVRWNHAFSILQLNKPLDAKNELVEILASAHDPVLRLLCLYLLDVFGRQDPSVAEKVAEGRARLQRELSSKQMRDRIEKSGENMEIVILSKIVNDAREWLYAPQGAAAGVPAADAAPSIAAPDAPPESGTPSNEPIH